MRLSLVSHTHPLTRAVLTCLLLAIKTHEGCARSRTVVNSAFIVTSSILPSAFKLTCHAGLQPPRLAEELKPRERRNTVFPGQKVAGVPRSASGTRVVKESCSGLQVLRHARTAGPPHGACKAAPI